MNSAANETEKASESPIVIHADSTKKIEVVGTDRHRFYVTMQEAAESCAKGIDHNLWQEQFREFLAEIHLWCKKNSDSVLNCYVNWSEGHLKIFMIVPGEEYRFDLDDKFTELELLLSRTYPDHYATLLQIPETPDAELASFVSPGKAIQVYGKQIAASGQSGT